MPTKVLVYSPALPPEDSGQAIVIHRLFERIDPRDYRLVAFGNGPPPDDAPLSQLPSLLGRAYRLSGDWWGQRRQGYRLQPVRDLRTLTMEATRRGRALARIVRDEGCGAIIAASGMLPDLPAAFIASRLTAQPLVVQMFDHWRYKEVVGSYRRMAAVIEPIVLRRAAGVIVPNELIGEELARRYGCDWTLIRNPIDDRAMPGLRAEPGPWPTDGDEIRIVYTGQVYDAHFDAFRNLLRAIEERDLQNVRLHIYSAQTVAQLERGGVRGRLQLHPHVPPPAIYEIQRRADILFLPLAFDSPYPEIIRTSAPTKLGDYLVSGRPMLVHAPAGSYPCWFAEQYRCGLVVDQASPELLAAAIRRIRDDAPLRGRLATNAQALAREEFSVAAARSRLSDLLAQVRRG